MEQPVEPFDLVRVLVGEQQPLFFAEILMRTIIVYAYTFGLVRWLGGRSVAQLSVIEFLLVIALGSAVGDAMFYPNVPLLHALLVITIVVLINKFIDTMLARVPVSEKFFDASPVEVVKNGELLSDGLTRAGYGPQEIIEQLRMQGIRNLGEVETAILESNGHMSVFKLKKPVKGLALLPPADARTEAAFNYRNDRQAKGKGKAPGCM